MNIAGTIIFVVLITLILNFILKRFNILIDQINISNHKSFINGYKTIPLSGGIVFFNMAGCHDFCVFFLLNGKSAVCESWWTLCEP